MCSLLCGLFSAKMGKSKKFILFTSKKNILQQPVLFSHSRLQWCVWNMSIFCFLRQKAFAARRKEQLCEHIFTPFTGALPMCDTGHTHRHTDTHTKNTFTHNICVFVPSYSLCDVTLSLYSVRGVPRVFSGNGGSQFQIKSKERERIKVDCIKNEHNTCKYRCVHLYTKMNILLTDFSAGNVLSTVL